MKLSHLNEVSKLVSRTASKMKITKEKNLNFIRRPSQIVYLPIEGVGKGFCVGSALHFIIRCVREEQRPAKSLKQKSLNCMCVCVTLFTATIHLRKVCFTEYIITKSVRQKCGVPLCK